jgi:hypothetical protein
LEVCARDEEGSERVPRGGEDSRVEEDSAEEEGGELGSEGFELGKVGLSEIVGREGEVREGWKGDGSE